MYRLGHQSRCKVQNINDVNLGREECCYPNPHHTMTTHLRFVSEQTIFCCATKAKGTMFGLMLFCRLTPSCICNMSIDMVMAIWYKYGKKKVRSRQGVEKLAI